MKKLIAMAMIVVAGLAVLSCGSGAIDGKWTISTVGGETVKTVEKIPYISFNGAEGRINACFGVNTANGSYTYENGKLGIDNLMMTMMAGIPQDMEVENKVREAVGNVASAKIKGNKLLLYDSAGKELMTLVKEQ